MNDDIKRLMGSGLSYGGGAWLGFLMPLIPQYNHFVVLGIITKNFATYSLLSCMGVGIFLIILGVYVECHYNSRL